MTDADGGTRDVLRVPVDGGAVTLLASSRLQPPAYCSFETISGDDQLFALCMSTSDGGRSLVVLPTSGLSQPAALFPFEDAGFVDFASFSPDSKQLAFRSNLESNGTLAHALGLHFFDLTAPSQPPVLLQRVDGGRVWSYSWTP